MKQYKGVPIGYLVQDAPEVWDYPRGLYDCASSPYATWQCCVMHSCCCAPWAHAAAMAWVNPDLGKKAQAALVAELKASAARGAADGVAKATGRESAAAEVFTSIQEIESDTKYIGVRELFEDYMFGVWEKNPQGLIYLVGDTPSNPLQACWVQVCCAPCARCQEVDAAMQWRQDYLGSRTRYANPFECDRLCVCKCGFEEYNKMTGEWMYPASVPDLPDQLVGDNLLGRQGNPKTAAYRQYRKQEREARLARRNPPPTAPPSLISMKR